MRSAAIVPAFDAERTVFEVVRDLVRAWPIPGGVFVVDDGSADATRREAERAGVAVLRHPENRGKGAALRTGMEAARLAGFDSVVTLDADGQHPVREAVRLALHPAPASAMILGIRDLAAAGAPRPNQVSNRISNFFMSAFSGRSLADTQCGLRRYPLPETLELDARGDGYAFEAEIILRALAAGIPIIEEPIEVYYPPEEERVTHFNSVRDPMRIVFRIVQTLVMTGGMQRPAPKRQLASIPPEPPRSAGEVHTPAHPS
jgi:glycosyltransferase involved in cell wall biosynthesis